MTKREIEPASLTAMRRNDRARDDEWIRRFITASPFCHIATVDHEQPFITPMSFAYDPARHCLYFHTAKQGRLRLNTDSGSKVCVSVAEMGRLLPARTARSFSVEYRSVVIFGRISIVEDPAEATLGMQILIDRYFPHLRPDTDYRAIQPADIEEISVYRIDIECWSGKEKKADPSADRAFRWVNDFDRQCGE